MLKAYLLDPDNKPVGVLRDDFTYRSTKDIIFDKISFYKDNKHLFVTELNVRRFLKKGDTAQITFDSGISFYYTVVKISEPFAGFAVKLLQFKTLRKVIQEYKHECQTGNQFSPWSKQVYEVLFNEK